MLSSRSFLPRVLSLVLPLTAPLAGAAPARAAHTVYNFRAPQAGVLTGSSAAAFEADGIPLEIEAGVMDQDGQFTPGAEGAVLAVVAEAPFGSRGEGLGVLSNLASLSFPDEALTRGEGLAFRFDPRFQPSRFTLSGFTQGPDATGEGAFEAVRVFVNGRFLADVPGEDGGIVTVQLPAGVATLAITPLLGEVPEIPLISSDPVFYVASIEGTRGTPLALDLRPGACPNPLNATSRGAFPAAVYGTAALGAALLDPASIRLAGVRPLRAGLEDVGTPAGGGACGSGTGDRIPDLKLQFDTQALVRAVRAALGPLADGQEVVLQLTGRLHDGTPVVAEDSVVLRLPHKVVKK